MAAGDFTPFGYLRNPYHSATSWTECTGGSLATSEEVVGFEWTYPWYRDRAAGAGLCLGTFDGERPRWSRSDFAAAGYTSPYHSALAKAFRLVQDEVELLAHFFLLEDTLCLVVRAENSAAMARSVRLGLGVRAWSQDAQPEVTVDGDLVRLAMADEGQAPAAHVVATAGWGDLAACDAGTVADACAVADVRLELEPGAGRTLVAALARHADGHAAETAARAALQHAPAQLAALQAEDTRFSARCPTLSGDWPRSWREGFLYDFETTRLLLLPAGGIFRDVWPAWMVAWPRVVLAEGALDMLRLAYASPGDAQRAVLSMFRDAPAANVPCVFQDGSPNMVARDGSVCGTSPAWCLPFLNLELLYLRTLDRAWLAELYPYLGRYLDWWLEHRVHADGWAVYKCTWEAGEDGNPRLDPSGSGDADISGHIAPVELQATVAHAAGVLAFFAAELGLAADARRWGATRDAYRRRTRRLFDRRQGRFRDWLLADERFQESRPGERYWGVDSRRFSPLGLTPLLGGTATAAQAQALRSELVLHMTAPWTLWPSWSYVLAECAAAAGEHELAGRLAASIAERVYRWTDRRDLGAGARPLPGAAPEFWPMDWHDYAASDAYGWGATTANLVLRHLLGLQESRDTTHWVVELAPAFPATWLEAGRRYGVRRFQYRGRLLDLAYRVDGADLEVELRLDEPLGCRVADAASGSSVFLSDGPSRSHTFRVRNGQRHALELTSADEPVAF
jgi:hypothetical protein